MSEMVDRVAAAIRCYGHAERAARAGIKAMLEPTKDMLAAIPGTADPAIADIAAEHWRLMIAAALSAPHPVAAKATATERPLRPSRQPQGQPPVLKSSDPKIL
jgi:hypothetical protein